MCSILILFNLFVLLISVNPASLLSVTKCSAADSKCIKESAQKVIPIFAKGVPEHGVESLDPAFIKTMDASVANLKFLLNDVTITGLGSCEVKKLQRDVAKSKMFLEFLCEGQLEGNYELSGQLLIIPIQGSGKLHALLRKTLINLEFDMGEKTGEDGVKHWQIKRWQHTYELKDKSNIVFENLFDGNKVLAQAANDLIANNGNDVVREIGTPVIKAMVAKVVTNINHYFKSVPASELSLD